MRHISIFLFVIAMFYSITGYSQNINGNWQFDKAELHISPIGSSSLGFTPSKTALSIDDLSLSDDWESVPYNLQFTGSTVLFKSSSLSKEFYYKNAEQKIIVFDKDENNMENTINEYVYTINANILELTYTIFRNNNKDKTCKYTVKCTYRK